VTVGVAVGLFVAVGGLVAVAVAVSAAVWVAVGAPVPPPTRPIWPAANRCHRPSGCRSMPGCVHSHRAPIHPFHVGVLPVYRLVAITRTIATGITVAVVVHQLVSAVAPVRIMTVDIVEIEQHLVVLGAVVPDLLVPSPIVLEVLQLSNSDITPELISDLPPAPQTAPDARPLLERPPTPMIPRPTPAYGQRAGVLSRPPPSSAAVVPQPLKGRSPSNTVACDRLRHQWSGWASTSPPL
jgi:hypothetical protein